MDKPLVKKVPAHTNNYLKTSYPKTGIVLHWIVGSLASADKTFQDPARIASTHYGIGKNGEIHQYVEDKYTAYHAGVGSYNRSHFGIEHEGGHLYNGERVKPSPACHEASIKLVAWLCKTYNIPCDRKHIIRHKETGYATECCGTLDIDYIVTEASKLLNQPPMGFNYELYVKGSDLYMRVLSGSINQNVTVKNITKGTSWQVFCNKSVGNDGGPINTGMEQALYEVNALGVVKQFDARPDPCASVKTELANAQKVIASKDTEINKLNGALGGMTTDRNKYQNLSDELQKKLDGEMAEINRLNLELEGVQVALKDESSKVTILENELNNTQPKIQELEKRVATLEAEKETLLTVKETLEKKLKESESNKGEITLSEFMKTVSDAIRNLLKKRR